MKVLISIKGERIEEEEPLDVDGADETLPCFDGEVDRQRAENQGRRENLVVAVFHYFHGGKIFYNIYTNIYY